MNTIKNRKQKETRIITREEEAKIVSLLRSPEHGKVRSYYADVADLVEVLADTGMRLGEALALRNTDISFEKSLITIQLSKCNNHRRVPMTKRVAAILKRRQEAGHDKPFNLNEQQIHSAWSWAIAQIGENNAGRLVMHSLRKSCVQRLVDAGVELEVVYEWIGYAAIRKERRLARLPLHKLITAAEMLERIPQLPTTK